MNRKLGKPWLTNCHKICIQNWRNYFTIQKPTFINVVEYCNVCQIYFKIYYVYKILQQISIKLWSKICWKITWIISYGICRLSKSTFEKDFDTSKSLNKSLCKIWIFFFWFWSIEWLNLSKKMRKQLILNN